MRDENELGTEMRQPRLPETLQIGDFTLKVDKYSDNGKWDARRRRFQGVSGTAWLVLDCDGFPGLGEGAVIAEGYRTIFQNLEVVVHGANPQTQVNLAAAQRIQPGIQPGETLRLKVDLAPDELQKIVAHEIGIIDWLEHYRRKGQILVGFNEVTIMQSGRGRKWHIIQGEVFYPTVPRIPRELRVTLASFTLTIHGLRLTPEGASADVTAQLPGGLAELDSCVPASLDLGNIVFTPECAFYVERPGMEFGPWIIGDSGMEINGTGFTLDLSLEESPAGKPDVWRGLILHSGFATGEALIPQPSNTGYLGGQYGFSNAELTVDGLDAHLVLRDEHRFECLHPLGYIISLEAGWLNMTDSRLNVGELGPGKILLPLMAVCKDAPGNELIIDFNLLAVDGNLDLLGEVDCGTGIRLSWGELTSAEEEEIFWTAEVNQGFFYLPANPLASFCPAQAGVFLDPGLIVVPDISLMRLRTHGMAGLALRDFDGLRIFSPDRPGGAGNALSIDQLNGWLRIGCRGVDGRLDTVSELVDEDLGEPARWGYVGNEPFKGYLYGQDKLFILAQYVSSAVYESEIDGHVIIPEPCRIDRLNFHDMELTSTAHLVGGEVELPVGGVTLDYWQLQFVPTRDRLQAGVISVRTGRIVFTAAGINEPIHFSEPFRLIWGEMLADGNLGELFFDYNNYGQRFDLIPYSPQHISLSEYAPGTTDAYLATCGTVHFNFFGPRFVNIQDARYHDPAAPYFSRFVTVPKEVDTGCPATDLHLLKDWDDLTGNELALFDFPDAHMDYFVDAQNGFIGEGSTDMSFLHSNGLLSTIEIHHDAIDISFRSSETHDLDLGLHVRLGGMSEIRGCARIEGPLLSCISLFGYLEHGVATGAAIISAKAAMMVEVNLTITPNTLDFAAAGDLLMQVAGASIDLSASVHLLHDFSRLSCEGEVIGRIDCNAILVGLEGEGQVTWYADPTEPMYYLQGRLRVRVCGWLAEGGMEGGFFLGHNVAKELAWVLPTDNERFGVPTNILSDSLTGIYGYGRISTGINLYVFGGGVDLFAGMGVFTEGPPGLPGLADASWAYLTPMELPYLIGSLGVYVHGEILGGLVSASAWAILSMRGPKPIYFEGKIGLEGCVLWVICASIEMTAGLDDGGFYCYL